MIISKTPYRISFFGGGTDYPAWYREHGGRVLATTIDRYIRLSCRHLPPFFEYKHKFVYSKVENVNDIAKTEHPVIRSVLQMMNWGDDGLEIHYEGDLPARAGMGSSSAFTVGLIHSLNALREKHMAKEELALQAIRIEQDILKENVGSQDQISAAFGGFNVIDFRTDGRFHASPVVVPRTRVAELEKSLLLVFTGLSRNATDIAKKVLSKFSRRTTELERMGAMVDEAMAILQDPSVPLGEFGKLLHRSWELKRSLSDAVSTRAIDETYQTARDAGAIGGKLLGAGGGGFLLFFVNPENRPKLQRALKHLIQVPFRFESLGSHIVVYQPEEMRAAA